MDKKPIGISILLMIVMQIPSLIPLIKYTPHALTWTMPCYFLIIFGSYIYLLSNLNHSSAVRKILDSQLTMIFLLALILAANLLLYPHELALQAIGRGSDAGDALIKSGNLLLKGNFPYSIPTYLHNPISPGPGWVLMLMPFTCTGLYVLLIPFFSALSA